MLQAKVVGNVSTETAGGTGGKDWHRVKQQNKQLKEENNLLKIKVDLLLDMVSLFDLYLYICNRDVIFIVSFILLS